MQELLSRPRSTKGSDDDEEAYELNLLDRADQLGFDVQVIRHSFGDAEHEIEQVSKDHFTNLDDAKRHYAALKRSLADKGFSQLDLG